MSTQTPATTKAAGSTTGSKKSSTPASLAKAPAKKTTAPKPAIAKTASTTTAQSTPAKPKATPKPATTAAKVAPTPRKAPTKTAPTPTAPAATKKSKQPAAVAAPAPEEKVQKIKLVRDSFTIPENEYQTIGEIKKACLALGVDVKRTEIIRAGLLALQQMSIREIADYISKKLPKPKTGRPKKAK